MMRARWIGWLVLVLGLPCSAQEPKSGFTDELARGQAQEAVLILTGASSELTAWRACADRLESTRASVFVTERERQVELEQACQDVLSQPPVKRLVIVAAGKRASAAVALARRVAQVEALVLLTPELGDGDVTALRALKQPVLLLSSGGDAAAVERVEGYASNGRGARVLAHYPATKPVVGASLVDGHFTVGSGTLVVHGSDTLFAWTEGDGCQEFLCYPGDTVSQFIHELRARAGG